MIHCLEETVAMLEDGKSYKEILPVAKKGLSASRLRKMMEEKELADA